jgi:hypothetical protein
MAPKKLIGRNSRFLTLTILVVLIALAIFLFAILSQKAKVLEKKEIPVFVTISNVTGFKVEDQSLDFGRIIYGSSANKKIGVQNNYKFPIVLELNAEGNVSDFLVFDKTTAFEPGEEKQISVSTIIFEKEPYGNYSGKLIVTFKRAY